MGAYIDWLVLVLPSLQTTADSRMTQLTITLDTDTTKHVSAIRSKEMKSSLKL